MPGEARCEPHEMILDQCGYCRPRRQYDWHSMHVTDSEAGRGQPSIAGTPQTGPAFPAQLEGDCAGCGKEIRPGDHIHYDRDLRGYACAACLPEPEVLNRI